MEKWLAYLLIVTIIVLTVILLALFSIDVLFSPSGFGGSEIGINLAPELRLIIGLLK